MGCLSFLIDLIVTSVFELWFGAMQLIIPQKFQGGLKKVLKILVYIVSFVLLGLMFVAITRMIFGDEYTQMISEKLFCISFGISAIQIGLGLIIRNVGKKK